MDCKTARELITVYLDGELPDSQELEAHVAGCAECAQEVAAQRALARAMDTWPAVEPRHSYAYFRARVPARRRSAWMPSPRWAAAVLVAVAFVGGSASGVYRAAHVPPHSHAITADQAQVMQALDLDAFGGGLSDVVAEEVAR